MYDGHIRVLWEDLTDIGGPTTSQLALCQLLQEQLKK
jgi:hypothetical protein